MPRCDYRMGCWIYLKKKCILSIKERQNEWERSLNACATKCSDNESSILWRSFVLFCVKFLFCSLCVSVCFFYYDYFIGFSCMVIRSEMQWQRVTQTHTHSHNERTHRSMEMFVGFLFLVNEYTKRINKYIIYTCSIGIGCGNEFVTLDILAMMPR